MHQSCKHAYLASRCSDFKSCGIARAPKESQCNSRVYIFVLVQSPVAFEGELKAKLVFFLFFFSLRQLKGKYKLHAALRLVARGEQVGYPWGSNGTLYTCQYISQSSSNHNFAVLQDR